MHPLQNVSRKALEQCIGRLGALSVGLKTEDDGICNALYDQVAQACSAGKYGAGEGKAAHEDNWLFDLASDELGRWLRDQFEAWPHFSGDRCYPVPAPADYIPLYISKSRQDAAYWNLPKWLGEYGESRKALAQWLIPRLQAVLDTYPEVSA